MAAGKINSGDDYSSLSRLLHRLAFAHPLLQKALGEIESDLFAEKFADSRHDRPVFVTGLPRSGTTMLLEMLFGTGEFSTFTYREMPFVLAPLFWSSMTRDSRKKGVLKERAHGDGMEISFDSPEAFEEVVWLSYLRGKYVGADRLLPIDETALTAEFREAFIKLVRKLSAAQSGSAAPLRYLSKNNANISRIGALRSIFPDAAIFVCLRNPLTHVRSLMTQHKSFLTVHAQDAFARDYMRWIGHYDFGANFRPIDFAARNIASSDAVGPDFWLRYWIDAYSFAEARGDEVTFVCYEKFFPYAGPALSGIADVAKLASKEKFIKNAERIRQPTTTLSTLDGADPDLVDMANSLYQRLAARPPCSC